MFNLIKPNTKRTCEKNCKLLPSNELDFYVFGLFSRIDSIHDFTLSSFYFPSHLIYKALTLAYLNIQMIQKCPHILFPVCHVTLHRIFSPKLVHPFNCQVYLLPKHYVSQFPRYYIFKEKKTNFQVCHIFFVPSVFVL